MRTIPAGVFKQTCLRLLDQVRETGESIVISKRGKPVAQLAPLPVVAEDDWSGVMVGTGRVVGDLVAPATDLEEWNVLRR